MNRHRKLYLTLGLCIAVGLPVGMAARAALTPEVDRVDAAIAMFTKYCIPFANGYWVEEDRSLVEAPSGSGLWTDVYSQMSFERALGLCAVSDNLDYLTEQERTEIRTRFEALVETTFPSLSTDENHGLEFWDEFSLWAQYPYGHPRRWIARSSRFEKTGEEAGTEIAVSRRPSEGT